MFTSSVATVLGSIIAFVFYGEDIIKCFYYTQSNCARFRSMCMLRPRLTSMGFVFSSAFLVIKSTTMAQIPPG